MSGETPPEDIFPTPREDDDQDSEQKDIVSDELVLNEQGQPLTSTPGPNRQRSRSLRQHFPHLDLEAVNEGSHEDVEEPKSIAPLGGGRSSEHKSTASSEGTTESGSPDFQSKVYRRISNSVKNMIDLANVNMKLESEKRTLNESLHTALNETEREKQEYENRIMKTESENNLLRDSVQQLQSKIHDFENDVRQVETSVAIRLDGQEVGTNTGDELESERNAMLNTISYQKEEISRLTQNRDEINCQLAAFRDSSKVALREREELLHKVGNLQKDLEYAQNQINIFEDDKKTDESQLGRMMDELRSLREEERQLVAENARMAVEMKELTDRAQQAVQHAEDYQSRLSVEQSKSKELETFVAELEQLVEKSKTELEQEKEKAKQGIEEQKLAVHTEMDRLVKENAVLNERLNTITENLAKQGKLLTESKAMYEETLAQQVKCDRALVEQKELAGRLEREKTDLKQKISLEQQKTKRYDATTEQLEATTKQLELVKSKLNDVEQFNTTVSNELDYCRAELEKAHRRSGMSADAAEKLTEAQTTIAELEAKLEKSLKKEEHLMTELEKFERLRVDLSGRDRRIELLEKDIEVQRQRADSAVELSERVKSQFKDMKEELDTVLLEHRDFAKQRDDEMEDQQHRFEEERRQMKEEFQAVYNRLVQLEGPDGYPGHNMDMSDFRPITAASVGNRTLWDEIPQEIREQLQNVAKDSEVCVNLVRKLQERLSHCNCRSAVSTPLTSIHAAVVEVNDKDRTITETAQPPPIPNRIPEFLEFLSNFKVSDRVLSSILVLTTDVIKDADTPDADNNTVVETYVRRLDRLLSRWRHEAEEEACREPRRDLLEAQNRVMTLEKELETEVSTSKHNLQRLQTLEREVVNTRESNGRLHADLQELNEHLVEQTDKLSQQRKRVRDLEEQNTIFERAAQEFAEINERNAENRDELEEDCEDLRERLEEAQRVLERERREALEAEQRRVQAETEKDSYNERALEEYRKELSRARKGDGTKLNDYRNAMRELQTYYNESYDFADRLRRRNSERQRLIDYYNKALDHWQQHGDAQRCLSQMMRAQHRNDCSEAWIGNDRVDDDVLHRFARMRKDDVRNGDVIEKELGTESRQPLTMRNEKKDKTSKR